MQFRFDLFEENLKVYAQVQDLPVVAVPSSARLSNGSSLEVTLRIATKVA
jgi:hypothetical protein